MFPSRNSSCRFKSRPLIMFCSHSSPSKGGAETFRVWLERHPLVSFSSESIFLSDSSRIGYSEQARDSSHQCVDSRDSALSVVLEVLERASNHLLSAPWPPRICSDLAMLASSSISGIGLIEASTWISGWTENGFRVSCRAISRSLSMENAFGPLPRLANSHESNVQWAMM